MRKIRQLKIVTITAIVYIVLSFVSEELCTQFVVQNNVHENMYNYYETYSGYYEPIPSVLENNQLKLSREPIVYKNSILRAYLDGEGNSDTCLQVWGMLSLLAEEITKDIPSDYEKVREIAKYVAYTTYYDWDTATTSVGVETYNLARVLDVHRTTCTGYSNLFAAMCETQGFNTVSMRGGVPAQYAGIEIKDIANSPTNHEWVGVYVDDELILVDITWMSNNRYEEGKKRTGKRINYIYFDMSLEQFSIEHRIDVVEERNFAEIIEDLVNEDV